MIKCKVFEKELSYSLIRSETCTVGVREDWSLGTFM